jgi:hypothetical protein
MLNLDQVWRELDAIDVFDSTLLAEDHLTAEEMIGFKARAMRKQELTELAKSAPTGL